MGYWDGIVKVTIWKSDQSVLVSENFTSPGKYWNERTTTCTLLAGQTYRIAAYTTKYHSMTMADVAIVDTYKINSVLKDNFGVDIKVDRIGRILSTVAKNNHLKRLNTNIPKYKLQISKVSGLQYF